jgi:peptidoglycan/LPS O-acetylase OafA/YrhL
VIVHTAELSQIELLDHFSKFFSSVIAVDSFFIVSGFLIFMIYENSSSFMSYASKRVRRIFPAYSTVILLCAFLFYFISTKSFDEYFNIEFIRYIFFNLFTLNFIQPTLAGVFESNPLQAINGALWTIKIEIAFYILVPLIVYLFSKSNKLFTLITIYLFSIIYSMVLMGLFESTSLQIYLKLEKQIFGQLAFFVSGALLYYYYDLFSKNSLYMLVVAVSILLIDNFLIDIYFLYPLALSIVVIYFATQLKYLGDFGRFGDISFGLYIWHFPIVQVFVHFHLFDNLALGLTLLVFVLFSISLLSWHVIEKRFLYPSSHYKNHA